MYLLFICISSLTILLRRQFLDNVSVKNPPDSHTRNILKEKRSCLLCSFLNLVNKASNCFFIFNICLYISTTGLTSSDVIFILFYDLHFFFKIPAYRQRKLYISYWMSFNLVTFFFFLWCFIVITTKVSAIAICIRLFQCFSLNSYLIWWILSYNLYFEERCQKSPHRYDTSLGSRRQSPHFQLFFLFYFHRFQTTDLLSFLPEIPFC